MKSVKIGGVALAICLLAAGVFLLLRITDHRGELRQALLSRNARQVEKLLKAHPKLARSHDVDSENLGWTPMHIAAFIGDPALVEALAKHHALMEEKDKRGLTPLLCTAFDRKHAAAQALLEHGANINARGRDGRTALELAKVNLDTKMIELLRERGAKE